MEAMFPLLFVGFFGMIIWFGLNSAKKRQQLYRDSAATLGLECFASGKWGIPRLMGQYRGFEVVVDQEIHGSGKHKTTYTRFKAQPLKPLPLGLNVSKEGLGSKIGKFFGGQDIQIGDKRLDDALLIKGQSEVEVQKWFQQAGVGQAVMRFVRQGSQARLTDSEGGVILVLGHMGTTALLQRNLDALVDHLIPLSGDAVKKLGSPDLFFEPDAPKRKRAPEQVPVASPAPTPTKKRWDLSDMQAQAEPSAKPTSAPRPTPAPASPSSEPVAAPTAEIPASGADVDPRLVRLSAKDLGYRERSELLEALKGQVIEVRLTVKESERSRGLGMEEPYRDGQTVIGSVGPCELGIRCPLAETDAVGALRAGETRVWRVRILDWDNFYRRASAEKVV
ncbi:MAG: hypothetical protein ACI9VR_000823 [Cognaticolwellia sp.]|jgi:hypothetical protein